MAAFSAHDLRSIGGFDPATTQANPHAAELERVAQKLKLGNQQRVISAPILEGLIRLAEICLIGLLGIATFAFAAGDDGSPMVPLLSIPVLTIVIAIALQSLGTYRVAALRAPLRFSLRIACAWFGVFGIAFVLGRAAYQGSSGMELWLGRWAFFGCLGVAAERAAVSVITTQLTRSGRMSRRTVLVGGGPAAKQLLEDFDHHGSEDLLVLGIFDDRTDERSPDFVGGYPKLGNVDDLVEFARTTPIDLIIFTLPITAEQRLLGMLRKLWVLPVDIRLAAHMNKLRFRPRAYSYIGQVPVIDLFDKPLAEWDIVLKAVFDRIVGALCLLVFAPVMAATALAVKLDSKGPALFKQRRYGFNNELVEVFKFRSMYVDQLDQSASKLVSRGDPRVTRVGRFIRKTSLDELPQLFNVVFKGNLSLVGPRPHAVHAKAANALYDEVVDGYFARHRVRPGITGWAQINGWRGETDTSEKIQKRVECDLFYIENWSIFLDIYVLLATPLALARSKNAF